MAITSDLDIVNAACALLSVDPLQALTDELPGGQAAQTLYEPIIDLCLGLTPWSFARRTQQLGRLAGVTSPLGFAHVHQLPANRVGPPERLLADPSRPGSAVWAFDYDEEGRVHSDAEILYAQYTARVLPAMWHPVFRAAVIHAVAAGFCELLTGNSSMAAEMQAKAFGTPSEAYRGGMMRAALSADARATPARNLPAHSNPLLAAWGTDATGWR
jgi:hypothetical protein